VEVVRFASSKIVALAKPYDMSDRVIRGYWQDRAEDLGKLFVCFQRLLLVKLVLVTALARKDFRLKRLAIAWKD